MGTELGIKYYETSALTGNGISQAFDFLAKNILEKKKNDLKNDNGINEKLNLNGGVEQKRSCCK